MGCAGQPQQLSGIHAHPTDRLRGFVAARFRRYSRVQAFKGSESWTLCWQRRRAPRAASDAGGCSLFSQRHEWIGTGRASGRQVGRRRRDQRHRRQGDADAGGIVRAEPEQHRRHVTYDDDREWDPDRDAQGDQRQRLFQDQPFDRPGLGADGNPDPISRRRRATLKASTPYSPTAAISKASAPNQVDTRVTSRSMTSVRLTISRNGTTLLSVIPLSMD